MVSGSRIVFALLLCFVVSQHIFLDKKTMTFGDRIQTKDRDVVANFQSPVLENYHLLISVFTVN